MNIEYRQHVSNCLQASSQTIADEWLTRLKPVVQEELWDIFPTEQYLDHIPSMIEEIASLLTVQDENVSLSNSVISRKALQLGGLRHQQKATVSQLLREYDILAIMLDDFVRQASKSFEGIASIDDAISVTGSLNNIVRYILQCTVDAFTEKYMATIQEQTEKLLSFNNFLGHELRAPLQSALLNTELIMEARGLTDPDTKELLKIKIAIQTASSLIENIEELIQSSAVTNNDSPAVQYLALDGMIADLRAQFLDTLKARKIELRCSENMPELEIETGKLRLVLMNLISNSIKYSDTHKPERIIEVSCQDGREEGVVISVWDNGIGIPEKMLEDVKSLRVRAHRELDDVNEVGGEGIGLFLVAEAVKDLGGSVAIDSEEGQFTLVTITLSGAALTGAVSHR